MLNWLLCKSGIFIFILCKIVTFVWMYVRGSMCTTCTPVFGGQLLGVGWFLPSPLLRQGLSHFCHCTSYYWLRTTNCQPVLPCAPLFLHRHARITDVCNHVGPFMCRDWTQGVRLAGWASALPAELPDPKFHLFFFKPVRTFHTFLVT